MRTRTALLIAAVALLSGAVGAWALARSHEAAGSPPPAARRPARGAPAVLTLPNAQRVAEQTGLPILLLVAPPPPICAPARSLLHTFFEGDALARLWQVSVTAFVAVDPDSPSAAAQGVARRYPGLIYPCFLVLRHDGELLHAQISRLYPAYDLDQAPLEGEWGPMLTVAELAGLVDQAQGRGLREDRQLEAALAGPDSLDHLLGAARILEDRERLDEARAVLQRAAGLPYDPTSGAELAHGLVRLHDTQGAVQVLRTLMSRYPTSADAERWALELHGLGAAADPSASEPLPDLATLEAGAQGRGDLCMEAAVRAELAEAALRKGDRVGATSQVDWFAVRAATFEGDRCERARTLLRFAELAAQVGRFELAARWSEMVMHEYPDRVESQELKHGVLDERRHQATTPRTD